MPDSPAAPAIAPPPPARGRALFAATAALVGALVGAAAVGAAWLATRAGEPRDPRARPVGGPLTLPAALGGAYSRVADIALYKKSAQGVKTAERIQTWNAQSAARFSQSHGDAPAAAETYSDAAVRTHFTVFAARDGRAAPPFVPYEDAAYLGVVKPSQELLVFGKVYCVISNRTTPAGQEPAEESVAVQSCIRSSDSLTVQAAHIMGDLASHPRDVAGLVEQLWRSLGGETTGP
ncbi:MAG TPA: hypothetical protein VKB80_00120 [Kofleriaceae bacterium]|nr:hypothetical protein [Kofleriaceae bacterium]